MRRREFITFLGSTAVVWPVASRAQQAAMPVVGFMSGRSLEDSERPVAAFHRGLAEGGFVEGQNVALEYRWASGDYARLPDLAAELVQRRVNLLAAVGGDPSAHAAKAATSTIPIVFSMGGDPIRDRLVESFNRPGGNATGYTLLTNEMEPKRLGLLHELVPGVALYSCLLNPSNALASRQLQDLEEAARKLGKRIFAATASTDAELEAAFATLLREGVGALLVTADPFFDTRGAQIIAFALRNRLPAIYQFREYAIGGGLISYGPNIIDSYHQVGIYTGRILKGAKPSDLPVVQPTRFEFVINLKTATAIGLEIPPQVSARADEVIE